jgi:hypothetical protein
MASHEQVREGCHHVHLAAVLQYAAQASLLEAELALYHAEWMLTFCTDVSQLQAEACG